MMNRGKTVHMKEIVSLLIEKGADINITNFTREKENMLTVVV
jgi:hypothetical protein